VLITIIAGTFLARLPEAGWFRATVRKRATARAATRPA
jgi:monovalent cation:H+ antiporter-2, CPA2 family